MYGFPVNGQCGDAQAQLEAQQQFLRSQGLPLKSTLTPVQLLQLWIDTRGVRWSEFPPCTDPTTAFQPPADLIPTAAVYDQTGSYTVSGLTIGNMYFTALGPHDSSLTNGGFVYTTTFEPLVFVAQLGEVILAGPASQTLTTFIFPVTDSVSLVPAGAVFDDSGMFALPVTSGAFYVIAINPQTTCFNGPDQVIQPGSVIGIRAQDSVLRFSNTVPDSTVAAIVLPA